MENNTKDPEPSVTKGSSPIVAEVRAAATLDGTGSQHHANAAAIIGAFDTLEAMIENFTSAAPGRRIQIARRASISDNAMHKTALALKDSPNLAAAAGLTAEEVMDAIQYCIALRGVEARSQQFTRGVGDTVAEKRAGVGALCYKTLYIARQMTLKEDHRAMVPALREMEEAFRPRRRPSPPADERTVVKALQDAKRKAGEIMVDINTTPQATETHTQFKAGRDLEE